VVPRFQQQEAGTERKVFSIQKCSHGCENFHEFTPVVWFVSVFVLVRPCPSPIPNPPMVHASFRWSVQSARPVRPFVRSNTVCPSVRPSVRPCPSVSVRPCPFLSLCVRSQSFLPVCLVYHGCVYNFSVFCCFFRPNPKSH